MLSVTEISTKVRDLKIRFAERDGRMADVRSVRTGNVDDVLPGMFPEIWPKPIVANFLDITARDLAESIGIMPSINCSSGNMVSDSAKKFAARRTKIAHYYTQHSYLDVNLISGADRYVSYGFVPIVVEPDFEAMCPIIRFDDPIGAYPEIDLKGQVRSYTKRWYEKASALVAKFPDHESQLLGEDRGSGKDAMLEVVRYIDADQILLFVPERRNEILEWLPNRFGRCPVAVAFRPGHDDEPRGQFDDVMWVQLARARMALLALEATEKSVNAPTAVPTDVQNMPFGANSIIRSNAPEKIRKIPLDLPQAAFAEGQVLERDMRVGARYPEGRSGSIDASVVTGRGVQELQGSYDTQIKVAQVVLGHAIAQALQLAFEMDETFWPNVTKTIRGMANGTPFEEKYRPSRDIDGDYTVDVKYGFAAGMDPNRALVFLLQLRGDQLVSRDLVQRQLPMDVDVVQMQQQIDIEQVNDALKQGLFAMVQSVGILAQQGMDPTALLYQAARVIEQRERGVPLHEAIRKALEPKPQPLSPAPGELTPGAGASPPGAPGAESSPGAELPPGLQASGLPEGVAQGQAGMGAGGRPDLQLLLAGLASNGQPQMRAAVQRRIPA